ncbi:MAG: hypothetical protein ACLR7D_13365 [Lachnospira eligens]
MNGTGDQSANGCARVGMTTPGYSNREAGRERWCQGTDLKKVVGFRGGYRQDCWLMSMKSRAGM